MTKKEGKEEKIPGVKQALHAKKSCPDKTATTKQKTARTMNRLATEDQCVGLIA